MVSEREWAQLNEWVARIDRRMDEHERENDAKNTAQDIAIHAVEVAQAKAVGWQTFAPWVSVIVVGLAGLGAWLAR